MTEATLGAQVDEWEIVPDGPLCAWAELDNRTIFIRDPNVQSRKLGYTLRDDEYLIRRIVKEPAMDDTQQTLTTLERAQQAVEQDIARGFISPTNLVTLASAEALTRIADALEKAYDTKPSRDDA